MFFSNWNEIPHNGGVSHVDKAKWSRCARHKYLIMEMGHHLHPSFLPTTLTPNVMSHQLIQYLVKNIGQGVELDVHLLITTQVYKILETISSPKSTTNPIRYKTVPSINTSYDVALSCHWSKLNKWLIFGVVWVQLHHNFGIRKPMSLLQCTHWCLNLIWSWLNVIIHHANAYKYVCIYI